MDNAQKAIMIGVGLFITIIIISVVLLITNLGTGMVDDARENLGNMSASLQNTLTSSYDNKTVTGSDVQSLYTQYKESDAMLLVINFGGATPVIKSNNDDFTATHVAGNNYAEVADQGTTPSVFDADDLYDISTSARYKTYVIRDGETLVGVYCEIQ